MHAVAIYHNWCLSPFRVAVAQLAREHALTVYAVGGAVRDCILGCKPHDWDLLCPQAETLARLAAQDTGAVVVRLHDDPATFRLVWSPRSPDREELDIAAFRGPTLADDLRTRDFTLNSLAWRLFPEPQELLDPCGGLADLRARVIRANSPRVLADDPLRCLRAFRLAAELTATVEPATLGWIADHAPGLASVASERIGAEVFHLAAAPAFAHWLEECRRAGVLPWVLPEVCALQGIWQGGYHHLDVWGHTLLVLQELEQAAANPSDLFPLGARAIRDYLADPRAVPRLKLAALLHDVAKPNTRTVVEGRVRFIGHETVGADLARRVCARLRLPREDQLRISRLVRHHMRPIMLVSHASPEGPTRAALRRLMADSAPDGFGLLLLAAADLRACRGPATDEADQRRRLAALDSLAARSAQELTYEPPPPLLRGRDLITELGLQPGPLFGVILEAVERAQADGTITDRAEALALARAIAREGRQAPRGE